MRGLWKAIIRPPCRYAELWKAIIRPPRDIYDVKDLDVYYENCVIGGPGAFVIPVNDWSQFPEAIRRKLVLELAGLVPAPRESERLPVQLVAATAGYDCLIGEKIWSDRWGR